MKKYLFAFLTVGAIVLISCNLVLGGEPQSASGVTKATARVQTDINGHSVEQNNIMKRIEVDNQPGAIKHLYIISPYSGQVILYSTVKGKVTSGSKRLNPSRVDPQQGGEFRVEFPNEIAYTNEVLGDDGTYGSNSDYIFWWDSKGDFHQHFMTGGQIVHVASQPINVKSVIINVENQNK